MACPVGVKIRSQSVQEIAVSIMAQFIDKRAELVYGEQGSPARWSAACGRSSTATCPRARPAITCTCTAPGSSASTSRRERMRFIAELDRMNEELGYFEPRPWHRDNPQRPKVWAKDPSASNLWGIMPTEEMHK